MESERTDGEAVESVESGSRYDTLDTETEASIGARVRVDRHSFEADFKASLKTNDSELSFSFWSTIFKHLRCWLAVAAVAVIVLALLAGLIGGRLVDFIDTLLR